MTKLSPLLPALAATSAILAIVALGLAASILHTFYDQRHSEPWWLPQWPAHFDDRDVIVSISTCAVIAVFNLALIAARSNGTKSIIERLLAILMVLVAVVSIVVPAVLDNRAPRVDTIRTWTCRWSETAPHALGLPPHFSTLCERSVSDAVYPDRGDNTANIKQKAVFGLSITVFVLQIAVLGAVFVIPNQGKSIRPKEGN